MRRGAAARAHTRKPLFRPLTEPRTRFRAFCQMPPQGCFDSRSSRSARHVAPLGKMVLLLAKSAFLSEGTSRISMLLGRDCHTQKENRQPKRRVTHKKTKQAVNSFSCCRRQQERRASLGESANLGASERRASPLGESANLGARLTPGSHLSTSAPHAAQLRTVPRASDVPARPRLSLDRAGRRRRVPRHHRQNRRAPAVGRRHGDPEPDRDRCGRLRTQHGGAALGSLPHSPAARPAAAVPPLRAPLPGGVRSLRRAPPAQDHPCPRHQRHRRRRRLPRRLDPRRLDPRRHPPARLPLSAHQSPSLYDAWQLHSHWRARLPSTDATARPQASSSPPRPARPG